MNKVLIITYYWPPSGGAAVQRWLSFANNLSKNGWDVHLLTVDEKYATYQLTDKSLLDQIDPRIKVYKTKTVEPFKIFALLFGRDSIPKPAFSNETNPSVVKKFFRFIRGNFFIPDPRKGWKKFAVSKANEIIDKETIKCVITAGPPHSTHFIGKRLKEKKKVFWVTDFHDLWTDVIYYESLFHLPVVRKIDLKLERLVLEECDLIITVGEKYKEKLLTKSEKLSGKKIEILRIGYEDSLFQNGTSNVQSDFIITYTGSIADFYRPEILIYALRTIRIKYPKLPMKLRFIGVLSTGIRNTIIKAGLESILEVHGYLPHTQSIEYLKTSTVLLLVNPVTKDEQMVIPGKIYEYLAAHKPIINITKTSSETSDIVSMCEAGKTFDRNMQWQLENYLETLIKEWTVSNTLDIVSNEEIVWRFSRTAITNHLIDVLGPLV